MRTIRIGSRESRLAVVQSELVQKYLESQGVQAPIVTMKTTGDKILDRTLDQVGGKGLFVKELDAALLDGRSDISVHSLKDVPGGDKFKASTDRLFKEGGSKGCACPSNGKGYVRS